MNRHYENYECPREGCPCGGDYHCPHCRETRPTRARLVLHMDDVHGPARRPDEPLVAEDVDARMIQAGYEIRDLSERAESVLAELNRLAGVANRPADTRYRVLTQAWDQLMNEGNISGANIVMRMRDSG